MFWLINIAAWVALGAVLAAADTPCSKWPYWAIVATAAIIQLTGMATMRVG